MANAVSVVYYPEVVTINSSTFTPATGTETLASCTVTLYTAQGAIAGGVDEANATGFDPDAAAAPKAWYTFDPVALALTQPTFTTGQSVYSLQFTVVDSNAKRYTSVVIVVLKPKGS